MYFNELVSSYDRLLQERNIYHDLMRFRVREVLLVGSLYDSFVVESDGILTEQIYGEYFKLNLNTIPRVTCAYSLEAALDLFRDGRFDLVILMAGLDFDSPLKLAQAMKQIWPDIPILLMATNNSSLAMLDMNRPELSTIDRIFVWNGYSKLFVGMIKYVEDLMNVDADTRKGQVRVILIIEDSVRYYSRYLPLLYKVVLRQTQNLIEEEKVTDTYKLMSIHARPKILLASSYEAAKRIFDTYEPYLLTVITDISFPRGGVCEEDSGLEFVRMTKSRLPDLPVLIQSSEPGVREKANSIGADFADKNSESLEMELRQYFQKNLGFGDFRFCMPDGTEIAKAHNLKDFITTLHELPAESLVYHAERNHFSAWLMARGEIQMAKVLRPYQIKDFPSVLGMRDFILKILDDVRKEKARGVIPYFDESMAMDDGYIGRLADGSVGGKGRGIIFIHSLLDNLDFSQYLKGIDIKVPKTLFIGIDEFEKYLESNGLWSKAFYGPPDEDLKREFIRTPLSTGIVSRLRNYLAVATKPLAVRSSGLFEDMLMVPFSGIYDTYIIPNNHEDANVRLTQICDAIRLIYASLFSVKARNYFEAAKYNLEEERMGIVIQELVGSRHGKFYYPHMSGVAQSYNYYPISYAKPEDGLCVSALGLGTYVVGGGAAQRFCPKYPRLDMLSPDHALENTQRVFHALSMDSSNPDLLSGEMASLQEVPITEAMGDKFFPYLASTWDIEDQRFVPGVAVKGPRVIDFANILKFNALPFAEAISMILDVGTRSMGTPVEIEYALNFDEGKKNAALYLLQLKPLIRIEEKVEVEIGNFTRKDCFLTTDKSMGNGRDLSLRDVVWVDPSRFNRADTLAIAAEIEALDSLLKQDGRNYILIGPGRWGTRDRWLGVPISFPQISRAKIIVEADLPDFVVESSLGSHFFHNLTSMNIKYIKIAQGSAKGYIDWDWLRSVQPRKETEHCVWTRLDFPLDVRMDGRASVAVILKNTPRPAV